jgi:stage V sporulation protein AD
MALKHVGNQSIVFANPPVILSSHTVVGPKEGQGPLGQTFNTIWPDNINGNTPGKLLRTK